MNIFTSDSYRDWGGIRGIFDHLGKVVLFTQSTSALKALGKMVIFQGASLVLDPKQTGLGLLCPITQGMPTF